MNYIRHHPKYSNYDDISSFYNYYDYLRPHWGSLIRLKTLPSRLSMELEWNSQAGAIATFNIAPTKLNRYNAIDIRIASDPDKLPAKFAMKIRDSNGNESY